MTLMYNIYLKSKGSLDFAFGTDAGSPRPHPFDKQTCALDGSASKPNARTSGMLYF